MSQLKKNLNAVNCWMESQGKCAKLFRRGTPSVVDYLCPRHLSQFKLYSDLYIGEREKIGEGSFGVVYRVFIFHLFFILTSFS